MAIASLHVKVLLVDDDELMRAGVRAVLSSDETIEVVGEAPIFAYESGLTPTGPQ